MTAEAVGVGVMIKYGDVSGSLEETMVVCCGCDGNGELMIMIVALLLPIAEAICICKREKGSRRSLIERGGAASEGQVGLIEAGDGSGGVHLQREQRTTKIK